jgi:hypothetical protein
VVGWGVGGGRVVSRGGGVFDRVEKRPSSCLYVPGLDKLAGWLVLDRTERDLYRRRCVVLRRVVLYYVDLRVVRGSCFLARLKKRHSTGDLDALLLLDTCYCILGYI